MEQGRGEAGRVGGEVGFAHAERDSALSDQPMQEGTLRQIATGTIRSPSFLLGIRLADLYRVDARYLALGGGPSLEQRVESVEERLSFIKRRMRELANRR